MRLKAVLGAEVIVKTLYGDIKMKIEPGVQNNDHKKLANYVLMFFVNKIGRLKITA